MIQTFELFPGGTLRCSAYHRFKQGCLSLQFVRPMDSREAAMNALLPSVLLRGTRQYPDMRAITLRLDDLYGASMGAVSRRVGDYQTTGLRLGFMEDRYAMAGDAILAPMLTLLGQILLEPIVENGGFSPDFVESEKKNLISTIESELNNKQAYCAARLMENMCKADSFGIPRLGRPEEVAAITPQSLYSHYQRILRESRVELFYVGAREPGEVYGLLKNLFAGVDRHYVPLEPQTPFHDGGESHLVEEMNITQSKLAMGYVTEITNRTPEFAAMQLLNNVFGGGMTSKLFMHIREKLSLCYSIGTSYSGTKGIVTLSAGIDADQEETVRREVARLLEDCRQGRVTAEELSAAREAVLMGLSSVQDSPGAIESYHSTAAISGIALDLEQYRQAVLAVTMEDVVAAAGSLRLHSSYFLKGVGL